MVQRKLTTNPLEVFSIQPSILEGTKLYSSAFREDQGKPIEFIPTVMVTAPYIEGDIIVPSTLYCKRGKWISSPGPRFQYQWLINGEPILGETTYLLDTIDQYSSQDISCLVTVTGSEGTVELETNVIVPLLEHTKDVSFMTLFVFNDASRGTADVTQIYKLTVHDEHPYSGEADVTTMYQYTAFDSVPVVGTLRSSTVSMYTVSSTT